MNIIKTKDIVQGTIKTIDRSAIAGQRMKERYVATKQKAKQSVYSQDSSAECVRYTAAVMAKKTQRQLQRLPLPPLNQLLPQHRAL